MSRKHNICNCSMMKKFMIYEAIELEGKDWSSINGNYNKNEKPIVFTNFLLNIISILSIVGIYYFKSSKIYFSFIFVFILVYCIAELSKRSGHKSGYLSGYDNGYEEGVINTFGLDDNQTHELYEHKKMTLLARYEAGNE